MEGMLTSYLSLGQGNRPFLKPNSSDDDSDISLSEISWADLPLDFLDTDECFRILLNKTPPPITTTAPENSLPVSVQDVLLGNLQKGRGFSSSTSWPSCFDCENSSDYYPRRIETIQQQHQQFSDYLLNQVQVQQQRLVVLGVDLKTLTTTTQYEEHQENLLRNSLRNSGSPATSSSTSLINCHIIPSSVQAPLEHAEPQRQLPSVHTTFESRSAATAFQAPRGRKKNSLLKEEEKIFYCSYQGCNKVYSKSSHLKAHLRRHTGEKPFACQWAGCGWRFSRSDELARHKRSHSGIKPYRCEICDKRFSRSDHLAKHLKVHRKDREAPAIHSAATLTVRSRNTALAKSETLSLPNIFLSKIS